MNINAPIGDRDGFPWPLLSSWYGGAPCDATTFHNLAAACVSLGMRRRLTIPVFGFRYFGGVTGITSVIYPFAVRLEGFARTARLTGFYVLEAGSTARLKVEVGMTSPSHPAKTIHMPPTVDRSGQEFAIDFDVGDGEEDTYGQARGYVDFEVVDEPNPTSSRAKVWLYGAQIEPLPAMQGEVTTT